MSRREKVRVIFWNIPRGKKLSRHTRGLSVDITTSSNHRLVIYVVESAEEWDLSCSISIFFFNLLSSLQYIFKFELFQTRLRFFRFFLTVKVGQPWACVETANSLLFSLVTITLVSRVPSYPHFPSLTSIS